MKFHPIRMVTALAAALCGMTASAVTITSFTVTPAASTPFTATLNTSIKGNVASITNSSVSCNFEVCSGKLLDYTLTGNLLLPNDPFSVTVDGTAAGGAQGTLTAGLTTTVATINFGVPFSIPNGVFNVTVIPVTLAPSFNVGDGSFTVSGSLNLSMVFGQSVSLPSSFSFNIGQAPASGVPEPGSAALFAFGIAVAALLRRRQ